MKPSLRELASYACGAAVAFAVDMALLAFLVEVMSVQYLIASTLSFMAGTAVIYWISIRYAFSYRRLGKSSNEFAAFTLIGLAGVLLNLSAMYVSVEKFHLHYLAGKVLSASMTFFANFTLRRVLLFTPWAGRPALKRKRSCD